MFVKRCSLVKTQTMTMEKAILQIARTHFPGDRLRAVTALKGGVSADVYRLDLETIGLQRFSTVLRVHGATHNGHNAALEYQLLQCLSDAGLAVPKPIAFDDSRAITHHPYLLLAHIDGYSTIPVQSVNACITTAANVLAAIHSLPTTALPRLPLRVDPLPELFTFLPHSTEWEPLRTHLGQCGSTTFTEAPALLHGDFWPGNWIWQGTELAGVIDWEDAAIGDPLSDVACACLELRYLYGTDGADMFVQAYARHRALDPRRLALWQAYVAAAGQHSMAQWGLDPTLEAKMRDIALQSIRDAAALLMY